MRDEALRRSFSEKDIDDSWVKKGSKNKLTGEREKMYVCPSCGHHAFALSPSSGWFHCWACGIWGQTTEGAEESRKRWEARHRPCPSPPLIGVNKDSKVVKKKAAITPTPYEGGGGSSEIQDFVRLDDTILDDIEDISLDSTVTGAQLAVRRYLEEQQIPLEWARKMQWGVATRVIKAKGEENGKARPCVVFRNYVEGICCNAKYRCVSVVTRTRNTPKGQVQSTVTEKGFAQESSFTPCAPYNIDCLWHDSGNSSLLTPNSTLIITEGEKDCLTLKMLGFHHVIAAANGAQTDHAKSFEAFLDWLEPIQTIVICGDMDKPGRLMTEALVRYFDTKTVKVCYWDQRYYGKDISDVRQLHGEDVARDFVLAAQPVSRDDIEDFSSEDAREAAYQAAMGNYDHGYSVGIGPMTDKVFHLSNQGGLVIVTGVPGTGKTDFLNFLTLSLLRERQHHVCYCSFETPDKYRHAGDLTHIWAGPADLTQLTREETKPFSDFIGNNITHISMRKERPTPEAVIRKAESVLAMHPTMEFLVIDPYLYLSLPQGRNVMQTDAIRDMLTFFQDWAHDHHIWLFLVAHPRMLHKEDGSDEFEELTYYSISGSANWANVADFVISLKRVQKGKSDYTRLSVLKVRDQKLCQMGDAYFKRQVCGRYDECASEADAISGKVIRQDIAAWPI